MAMVRFLILRQPPLRLDFILRHYGGVCFKDYKSVIGYPSYSIGTEEQGGREITYRMKGFIEDKTDSLQGKLKMVALELNRDGNIYVL
jgi:hypothetical protein